MTLKFTSGSVNFRLLQQCCLRCNPLECNAVFMGKQLTIFQRTVLLQNMANYSRNNSVMLQLMSL